MIELYYTGAAQANGAQDDPLRSLGGWISSNKVQNGVEHALFPLVSEKSMYDQKEEVRGYIIKNNTGAAITNLQLNWTDPAGGVCTFEFAAVTTTNNGTKMEQLSNGEAIPFVGTFYGDDSAPLTLIASLDDQATIGLWVKRKVSARAVFTTYDEVKAYCDARGGYLVGETESVSFDFTWNP